jgi:hypothetical protein
LSAPTPDFKPNRNSIAILPDERDGRCFYTGNNFSQTSNTLFAGLSDFSDNRLTSCPYFLCGGVF